MSWFARSIANSLRLDDEDSDSDGNYKTDDLSSPEKSKSSDEPLNSPSFTSNQSPKGVKEDFTELKKTLTRQFWGVAAFLAPQPYPSPSTSKTDDPNQDSTLTRDREPSPKRSSDPSDSDDEALLAGIRSDFAEIGGKLITGISELSNNKAVWEFTKIASNILQIGSESGSFDEELVGNAVGVTEDVLAFARTISMHPETWLDFPLQEDEDGSDEFELSDAQQEHALAIEQFAPQLSALRMELCPGYMSEGSFWKVYFVLLHPRLSKQDSELLSTPYIMETRSGLMQDLKNQNKATQLTADGDGESLYVPPSREQTSTHLQSSPNEAANFSGTVDIEMDKVIVESSSANVQVVDKPVVEEGTNKYENASHSGSSHRVVDYDKYEDEADDWLKEETPEMGTTTIPIEDEEVVSFSDLEEDDDDDIPISSYKQATYRSDSSTKDSRDWVQLGGGSSDDSIKDVNTAAANHPMKESNDWLNVDDINEEE